MIHDPIMAFWCYRVVAVVVAVVVVVTFRSRTLLQSKLRGGAALETRLSRDWLSRDPVAKDSQRVVGWWKSKIWWEYGIRVFLQNVFGSVMIVIYIYLYIHILMVSLWVGIAGLAGKKQSDFLSSKYIHELSSQICQRCARKVLLSADVFGRNIRIVSTLKWWTCIYRQTGMLF